MMGRRKALALLLAGLAGGSLAALLRRDRGAVWERTFSKDASAAAVGRAYLLVVPAEADATRLLQLLRDGLGRVIDGDDLVALRRELSAAIRRDFSAERTTSLDGWILSQTEARLCALATLVSQGAMRVSAR